MACKADVSFLDDKPNLVNDVSAAYSAGLYNDITFVTKDNAKISASKFMLAARIPYFGSMFFGGFAESLARKEIPLEWCDSKDLNQILNFVCKGTISFSDKNITCLLDLLQASHYLGIDTLQKGIEDYLDHHLGTHKVDLKECIAALKFTSDRNLNRASQLLIKFIDENLSDITSLTEFGSLTEASLKLVLTCEERVSSEIERYKAVTVWLKSRQQETLSEKVKNEIVGYFDLRKFEPKELVEEILGKPDIFSDQEVHKVLVEHFVVIKEKCVTLECDDSILELGTRKIFEIPSEFSGHAFNEFEFTLNYTKMYTCKYDVESSEDGVTWTKIMTRDAKNMRKQMLSFGRQKMKFIAVKVIDTEVYSDGSSDSDGEREEDVSIHITYVKVRMN